jgi:hypothetical protein
MDESRIPQCRVRLTGRCAGATENVLVGAIPGGHLRFVDGVSAPFLAIRNSIREVRRACRRAYGDSFEIIEVK